MTIAQAGLFLVFGGMLNLLPAVAPGYFPPSSFDGANTSALWLQFMGWINAGLGAGFVIRRRIWPVVSRVLAWRPALPPAMQPGELLRPALNLYQELETATDERERSVAA